MLSILNPAPGWAEDADCENPAAVKANTKASVKWKERMREVSLGKG